MAKHEFYDYKSWIAAVKARGLTTDDGSSGGYHHEGPHEDDMYGTSFAGKWIGKPPSRHRRLHWHEDDDTRFEVYGCHTPALQLKISDLHDDPKSVAGHDKEKKLEAEGVLFDTHEEYEKWYYGQQYKAMEHSQEAISLPLLKELLLS